MTYVIGCIGLNQLTRTKDPQELLRQVYSFRRRVAPKSAYTANADIMLAFEVYFKDSRPIGQHFLYRTDFVAPHPLTCTQKYHALW